MGIQNTQVEKAVTAQNTFTNTLNVGQNKKLNLSVWGTFVGTVVVQRKPAGAADSEYTTIATYTAAVEKIVENVGKWTYRAGILTGGFTSGTANVRLLY